MGRVPKNSVHTRAVLATFVCVCCASGDCSSAYLLVSGIDLQAVKVVFAGSAAILVQFYAP